MSFRGVVLGAVQGGLALLMLSSAATAQNFPNQKVTVVIPFTSGGSVDLACRYLATGLQKLWSQTVIVENRAGGGTTIGSAHVAHAKPDGYTLLCTSGSITTNAAVQPNQDFDPVTELAPVAALGTTPMVLSVGPRVKATTLQDFIKEAKTRDIFYATAGVGGAPHFASEMFNQKVGINMAPVHYKGGSEALVDLIGGRVDALFSMTPIILPGVRAGHLKALAVSGTERSDSLPEVPTLSESGAKDIDITTWWGVFAPSKTPADVVQKLNEAVAQVMTSTEAIPFLKSQGGAPSHMDVPTFQKMIRQEFTMWRDLAKERGIRIQ